MAEIRRRGVTVRRLAKGLGGVALGLSLGVAMTGLLAAPALAQTPGSGTGYNGELIGLTNNDRTSNGLAALAENGTLDSIAVSRSDDMITNDYFSHVQLNGQYVWPTMTADGIRFTAAGENIAWNSDCGCDPAADANAQFMGSSPHRENILGAYNELGVGSWYTPDSWNYPDSGGGPWTDVYMFTQEFAQVGYSPPPPSSSGGGGGSSGSGG
ncbi:MAG: CAP domain-containing protein, partial [Candidatus Dormiibacterota bacterium]